MSAAPRSRSLTPWLLLGLAGGLGLGRLRRRAGTGYSFRDRVVVITGGSRGLGLLLARQLAAEGACLALLGRSPEALGRAEEELRQSGTRVLAIPCDVRQREQVESAIQQAVAHFGRIDVLINNAGVIQVGPWEHLSLQDFEDALAVHLFGPLYTCLAAIPHLRWAGEGRIVNISSIGGRIAVPHLLPYTASKFALAGFSEGLYSELRQHRIFVTTVYPSLMRTGSPPNAWFKGKHKNEYAWFTILDSLPLLSMNAEKAAQSILEACRRGSPRLTLGLKTKAAFLINDLFPGLTLRLLALTNQLLPEPALGGGPTAYSGWQSQSAPTASLLTRLTEKAAARNNQLPVSS